MDNQPSMNDGQYPGGPAPDSCPWCGAAMPPDTQVCPQCNRHMAAAQGYQPYTYNYNGGMPPQQPYPGQPPYGTPIQPGGYYGPAMGPYPGYMRPEQSAAKRVAGILFIVVGVLSMLMLLMSLLMVDVVLEQMDLNVVINGLNMSIVMKVVMGVIAAYYTLPIVAGIRCLKGKGKVLSLLSVIPAVLTYILLLIGFFSGGGVGGAIVLAMPTVPLVAFLVATILCWKKPKTMLYPGGMG